ncbi:hypothetical protein R6Z07M_015339 [Ovis aries]
MGAGWGEPSWPPAWPEQLGLDGRKGGYLQLPQAGVGLGRNTMAYEGPAGHPAPVTSVQLPARRAPPGPAQPRRSVLKNPSRSVGAPGPGSQAGGQGRGAGSAGGADALQALGRCVPSRRSDSRFEGWGPRPGGRAAGSPARSGGAARTPPGRPGLDRKARGAGGERKGRERQGRGRRRCARSPGPSPRPRGPQRPAGAERAAPAGRDFHRRSARASRRPGSPGQTVFGADPASLSSASGRPAGDETSARCLRT